MKLMFTQSKNPNDVKLASRATESASAAQALVVDAATMIPALKLDVVHKCEQKECPLKSHVRYCIQGYKEADRVLLVDTVHGASFLSHDSVFMAKLADKSETNKTFQSRFTPTELPADLVEASYQAACKSPNVDYLKQQLSSDSEFASLFTVDGARKAILAAKKVMNSHGKDAKKEAVLAVMAIVKKENGKRVQYTIYDGHNKQIDLDNCDAGIAFSNDFSSVDIRNWKAAYIPNAVADKANALAEGRKAKRDARNELVEKIVLNKQWKNLFLPSVPVRIQNADFVSGIVYDQCIINLRGHGSHSENTMQIPMLSGNILIFSSNAVRQVDNVSPYDPDNHCLSECIDKVKSFYHGTSNIHVMPFNRDQVESEGLTLVARYEHITALEKRLEELREGFAKDSADFIKRMTSSLPAASAQEQVSSPDSENEASDSLKPKIG